MKFISIILPLILIILTGCGAAPLTETQKTISVVKNYQGQTKDELFESTKIWIAQNFTSSKAVLEYENKADGTIIGNGNIKYPCEGTMSCIGQSNWKLHFSMRVDFKDDRFKISFQNLELSWPSSYNYTTGTTPAHRGPISQNDYLEIQKKLLEIAKKLELSIKKEKHLDSW